MENLAHHVGVALDLATGARRLEKAEKRLQDVIESLREVLFTLDSVGNLTYITPNVTTLGFSPQDLLSKPLGMLFENGDREGRRMRMWDFRWSAVPAAVNYHLVVRHLEARQCLINRSDLPNPRYVDRQTSYILDRYRKGWRWKVRAMVDGEWTDWSEERTFSIGPMQTTSPPGSNSS